MLILRRSAPVLCLAAAVVAARADTDVVAGNGDAVTGSLRSGETETIRAFIPAGATLSLTVTGKKGRAGPAPAVQVAALRPPEVPFEFPAEVIRPGTGFRVAGYTAPVTGLYTFRISGDRAGDYTFKASWKGPSGLQTIPVQEVPPGAEAFASFSATTGAIVNVTVEAASGSGSRPRLLRIEGSSPSGAPWTSPAFEQPANDQAQAHSVTKVKLGGTGGTYFVVAEDISTVPGPFEVRVTVTPPKVHPRPMDLTSKRLGTDPANDHARGALLVPDGGVLSIGAESGSPFDGAVLDAPAGSVTESAAITLTSCAPLAVKGAVSAAGPAIDAGPATLVLRKSGSGNATLTIPFDPLPFFGDFTKLQVFMRTGSSKPKLVAPATAYAIDSALGTVTIPLTKLGAFQVFGPAHAAPMDIDGDGIDDLAVGAPSAEGGAGRVLVWFGSRALPALAAAPAPDLVLAGAAGDLSYGRAVAVGDVNGDGFADLAVGVVRDSGGPMGRVLVYFGSEDFTGAAPDAVLSGGIHDDLTFGSVLAAGDVTGDRVADLLAGAPGATILAAGEGRITAFKGRTGFTTTSADDPLAIQFRGGSADRGLGISLATGRANSDAFGDFVAGAAGGLPGAAVGEAFLVPGGQFLTGGVIGGTVFTGDAPGDRFGTAVAIADVDRDGKADFVVGAPGADVFSPVAGDLPDAGGVFVFRGAAFTATSASAAGYRLGGDAIAGEGRGAYLAGGNFGGTALRDVLAGTPTHSDDPLTGNGLAFLVRGAAKPAEAAVSRASTESAAGFGRILTAADLNGDGRAEAIVAAPASGGGAGTVTIYFGPAPLGGPTLVLTGPAGYRIGE